MPEQPSQPTRRLSSASLDHAGCTARLRPLLDLHQTGVRLLIERTISPLGRRGCGNDCTAPDRGQGHNLPVDTRSVVRKLYLVEGAHLRRIVTARQ